MRESFLGAAQDHEMVLFVQSDVKGTFGETSAAILHDLKAHSSTEAELEDFLAD